MRAWPTDFALAAGVTQILHTVLAPRRWSDARPPDVRTTPEAGPPPCRDDFVAVLGNERLHGLPCMACAVPLRKRVAQPAETALDTGSQAPTVATSASTPSRNVGETPGANPGG